ncbi:HpcH/HpaI aldolase/citrate lyase family protein [Hoeflea sp. WL0058]|uniref:HpcH/HpaI aldolase/citrate lyase family protein n=1 Tax=Flavimaribacter sediminis TaxID=2865987 RepID=A0AAE2ZLI2_9HYPH|nr:HpcH/HpaI aldolase/citrate lyase family protein [Flavimaribacter sediminis]MBW8638441.1 HpcH/HpaI aldolase/citrate lyase family protein [Flavimaribacter sediminis]
MNNEFKAALWEGRTQLGIWSSLCSPLVAEMLAQSGFDWVLFDAEHSPVEIAGLLPLLQAAGNGSATAVVRPSWNDPVLIKRTLDIGAQTLLLPFVQDAAEARAAVASARYPTKGKRGVAGATRASRYGRDGNYHVNASDEICTLVQVETLEALSRLDEISEVDGIDGVFIGPSDLSASMGHLGQPGANEVQQQIRLAANTIRAAGKAPGILATSADDAKRYLDWGYLFVACNVDLRLLVQSIDALYTEMTS